MNVIISQSFNKKMFRSYNLGNYIKHICNFNYVLDNLYLLPRPLSFQNININEVHKERASKTTFIYFYPVFLQCNLKHFLRELLKAHFIRYRYVNIKHNYVSLLLDNQYIFQVLFIYKMKRFKNNVTASIFSEHFLSFYKY